MRLAKWLQCTGERGDTAHSYCCAVPGTRIRAKGLTPGETLSSSAANVGIGALAPAGGQRFKLVRPWVSVSRPSGLEATLHSRVTWGSGHSSSRQGDRAALARRWRSREGTCRARGREMLVVAAGAGPDTGHKAHSDSGDGQTSP